MDTRSRALALKQVMKMLKEDRSFIPLDQACEVCGSEATFIADVGERYLYVCGDCVETAKILIEP